MLKYLKEFTEFLQQCINDKGCAPVNWVPDAMEFATLPKGWVITNASVELLEALAVMEQKGYTATPVWPTPYVVLFNYLHSEAIKPSLIQKYRKDVEYVRTAETILNRCPRVMNFHTLIKSSPLHDTVVNLEVSDADLREVFKWIAIFAGNNLDRVWGKDDESLPVCVGYLMSWANYVESAGFKLGLPTQRIKMALQDSEHTDTVLRMLNAPWSFIKVKDYTPVVDYPEWFKDTVAKDTGLLVPPEVMSQGNNPNEKMFYEQVRAGNIDEVIDFYVTVNGTSVNTLLGLFANKLGIRLYENSPELVLAGTFWRRLLERVEIDYVGLTSFLSKYLRTLDAREAFKVQVIQTYNGEITRQLEKVVAQTEKALRVANKALELGGSGD